MPIDTSIPLRAYEGQFNPAAALQQGFQLRDMMQQSQARDMQFQDQAEARAEKRTLRDLMRGAIGPDGAIDAGKYRGALAQTGDIAGLSQFDASQATQAAAARTAKAAEIKTAMDQVGYIAQLASGVRDEQSWRRALATAQGAGIDTAQYDALPYSPDLISTVRQQALTVGQQLEQQWKQVAENRQDREFAYRQGNDATNRAVTIRGQNMADARARETQGAPGMMTPKEARRQADKWRQDFDTTPEVKAYRAAVPVLVSAARAAPTAAGDLDLIYAMGKIMDPNSVVREGEMKLAGGSGSWADRLQGFVGKGSGAGPGLPAGMRKRLVDALANRVAALGGSYNQTASTYEGYAKGSGIDPKYLVGEHPGQQIRNAGLTSGSKKTSPAGGAVKIANDADYADLKSGALFIAPDGSRRRKP